MSTVDAFGLPVTLEHPGSLARLNDFIEGFVACEARVVNVLELAPVDRGPMVQACCAALHLFAETGDASAQARPFIKAALRSPLPATAREQLFVQAVAAWVDGDLPRAIALHAQLAREHPRDLAAVKLGQYHLFNRGDAPGMLRLALAARPACADLPWFHGMQAFALEQCHLIADAEAAARRAIALRHAEPWAHHALAHVMLTQGRLAEGRDFMASVSSTWTGLNSFMVTHNWWHLALFALDLDDADAVLRLYDTQVWGVEKAYSQDQVGAISLLARLELAGVDVGRRWDDVAAHVAARGRDHVNAFLDLQYLYALGRAGHPAADLRLAQIIEHAATAAPHDAPTWRQVAVPAARGLLTHARGNMGTAVQDLGLALPRLAAIGGSHAQRDLFAQIHLDALMRDGHWVAAQDLLQRQCNAAPESRRLARLAGQAYSALGLDRRDWS